MIRPPPRSTLFPYPPLSRSDYRRAPPRHVRASQRSLIETHNSRGLRRQRIAYCGYGDRWFGYLNYQLCIALIMQLNDDHVFGSMYVPKYCAAFLSERACCNDARKICAEHAKALTRTSANLGIGSDSLDVHDGNFQSTFQGPKFVPTLHFDDQLVLGYRYLRHIFLSSLP